MLNNLMSSTNLSVKKLAAFFSFVVKEIKMAMIIHNVALPE
jgi:hypothetical protein